MFQQNDSAVLWTTAPCSSDVWEPTQRSVARMDEASWQRSSSGQFRTSQSSIRTRFQNGARVDNTGIKMESRQPNEAQLESTWPWPDQFGITQDLLQATVEEIPRRSKQIAILGHSWPLGAPLQRRRTHRPWTYCCTEADASHTSSVLRHRPWRHLKALRFTRCSAKQSKQS